MKSAEELEQIKQDVMDIDTRLKDLSEEELSSVLGGLNLGAEEAKTFVSTLARGLYSKFGEAGDKFNPLFFGNVASDKFNPLFFGNVASDKVASSD